MLATTESLLEMLGPRLSGTLASLDRGSGNRLISDFIDALGNEEDSNARRVLLEGIRTLVRAGFGTFAQATSLVALSRDADGRDSIEENVPTIAVLGPRRDLAAACLQYITRSYPSQPVARWLAFYAASALLRFDDGQLLQAGEIRALQAASKVEAEQKGNEIQEYLELLALLKQQREPQRALAYPTWGLVPLPLGAR